MPEQNPFELGSNRSDPGDREGLPSADFHGLRDDVGRIAQQPGFDAVRRRAQRLRTRRQLVVAGAGLAVLAVVGATGLTVTRTTAANPPAATPSPTAPTSSPAPTTMPSRPPSTALPTMRDLYAGDTNHLYAVVDDCEGCQGWLMASRDGGRTWQQRLAVRTGFDSPDLLRVVGPSAIMVGALTQEGCTGSRLECAAYPQARTWRISADAGATWRDLAVTDQPVEAAPSSGALVAHLMTADTTPERLYAVDPEAGRVAPLANQPPLVEFETLSVPLSAGAWVEGLDPTTRRPAVAVSRDGGATWATSIFEAEKQVGDQFPVRPGISRPEVRTADGQTAYAMFPPEAGPVRIYRTTDGGRSWRRTNPDARSWDVPRGALSVVLAGGRHVLVYRSPSTSPTKLVASTDGRTYQSFAPTGLPPIGIAPIAVDKNLFLYRDYSMIYRSEDGLHWEPLTVPK